MYYKPMTIINDDSRVVNKLEASLTDNARVVIYNHHMFIVQATGLPSNIRLGWKVSPGTNTVAHITGASVTKEKSFMTSRPGTTGGSSG
jgi:hypothetical protein